MTPYVWLGTHRPTWLWEWHRPPLFVSVHHLAGRKQLRRATGPWAMDSNGFFHLQKHGRWTISEEAYVEMAQRCHDEIGQLAWIAPQDWMCEPLITGITGKTVAEHQELTVANGLRLRELAPDLPFRYVVQGLEVDDYLRCVELYASAGVDLTQEEIVGVGSVCRRQHTEEIETVFRELAAVGLKMHGFGVKTKGFTRYARYLASADSLAWSERARRHGIPLPECVGYVNSRGQPHKNCANCLVFAKRWYERTMTTLAALPEGA